MDDDILHEKMPANDEATTPANLLKRVVSGTIFAAIALALAWAGQLPFAALVLAAGLAMSWEWARVVRGAELDIALAVHAVAVIVAVALTAAGYAALGLAALVIGAIIVFSLEFGQHPISSATGVLYVGLPAVALLWLRGSEPMGFQAVLLILLIVAACDTAAFAAGRLIGGPKLAPRISPNKTWAGLAGGIVASAVTAAIFAIQAGAPPLALATTGLILGLLSQAGDLAESAWKRSYGVKDTSNLIPGHGGFMDRLDGVVVVAVAAALLGLFVNAHTPAEALFFQH